MDVKEVFSLPQEFEVTDVKVTDNMLTVSVTSTQGSVCCPVCSSPAKRVHSHYKRVLADLPCMGKQVRLLVRVCKFFCDAATCCRKIFAERLLPFIEPWARVTARLFEIVQIIGLATSGMLGVRVTERLGIKTSWMTIIRRIMALPEKPVEQVLEVGIDDFSFRRGRKFAAILVDMQSHEAIDMLPDRKAETAKAWFQEHPEIQKVSRDRGGEFASAAREGAPQAAQSADRYHLHDNLVKAAELTLVRCRKELRKVMKAGEKGSIAIENWKPAPSKTAERARIARHEEKHARYEQVLELKARGLPYLEIASRVGVCVRTVQRWLSWDAFPKEQRRGKRKSQFDPYAAYVLSRWQEGEHHGATLFKEIQAQGYSGSERMVYQFIVPLRNNQQIIPQAASPDVPLQDFSTKQAVWLFARDIDKLTLDERTTLKAICEASQTANKTYELVQEFRDMLHQLEGQKLDEWIAKVNDSPIKELQSFALGLERDKAAVVDGLTAPLNNGLVEGMVNKVKLIKRMMFGRAGFPLLRKRVLNAL